MVVIRSEYASIEGVAEQVRLESAKMYPPPPFLNTDCADYFWLSNSMRRLLITSLQIFFDNYFI